MIATNLPYPLPAWAYQLAWSVITVLVIYLMGRFCTRVICRRLTTWASKTAWRWDDLLIEALQRGIPVWSILFGLYVATGFWSLPEHTLQTIIKTLYVLAWFSITLIGAGLSGELITLYGAQFHQGMPATSLTQHIARIVITVLGGLMILHGLGVSIAPLLTALGVGGLAVALALQDTLSNLFAGCYLTMARQIRVGEYIKLDTGQEGVVEDISWRATKLRMLPNNMVLVPNHKLGQAIIINYDLPNRELAVLVELGVVYGSDLDRVEQVTVDVARDVMRTVPGGVATCEPLVRFHTFGESGVNFTAVLRARSFPDQFLVKHEFLKRLHVRYAREGIKIPVPTRLVLTPPAS